MNLNDILDDLGPFVDLGEDPPSGFVDGEKATVRLVRNGESTVITLSDQETRIVHGSEVFNFKSFAALLASPLFANLARWAESQKTLLGNTVRSESITIKASHGIEADVDAIEMINKILSDGAQKDARNVVVVIDGPAGIGKTGLVRRLSYERASSYAKKRNSLILHVESRGRVLQNITDLMAFSLQSLRSSVTYDQIPVLVKHGLITLAIDGFDELGDPNGYDLAWAQLNDLIESTRGKGSYVLSGRETFISTQRIRSALPFLSDQLDSLDAITVAEVAANVAKNWLMQSGWTEEAINSPAVTPLFETGSYALRPFFIKQLASPEVAQQVLSGDIDNTLTFLVDAMIRREADKFGGDVEAATTTNERQIFISDLMEEVARDIADNQTTSISADTISWLSDAVSQNLPDGVQAILRNRTSVIAFLTNDERRGFRRFIHDEVQNYFLARVTVRLVMAGEISKYMRRNIFSMDALESFKDVIRSLDEDTARKFVIGAVRQISDLVDNDKVKRNLSSFVLTAMSVIDLEEPPYISDVNIDEVFLAETMSPIVLSRVTITQMEARNTDFREVVFKDCHVVTLIADNGTVPSITIPLPAILVTPGATITNPSEVDNWLGRQYDDKLDIPIDTMVKSVQVNLNKFPLFKLLSRFARYKPFWLKEGEERSAKKILDDPYWPALLALLKKHDFILERNDVAAAGRQSTFYHLRNREALADFYTLADEARPLLLDIAHHTREALRREGA